MQQASCDTAAGCKAQAWSRQTTRGNDSPCSAESGCSPHIPHTYSLCWRGSTHLSLHLAARLRQGGLRTARNAKRCHCMQQSCSYLYVGQWPCAQIEGGWRVGHLRRALLSRVSTTGACAGHRSTAGLQPGRRFYSFHTHFSWQKTSCKQKGLVRMPEHRECGSHTKLFSGRHALPQ